MSDRVMMQSIICCKLFRRLFCTISRQTSMHSCKGSVAPMDPLTGQCKYHIQHYRTYVLGFSGEKLGNPSQRGRLQSFSHTSEANSSTGQLNLTSLETDECDGKDTADDHQALREKLRQMRDLGRHVPERISDADLEYYASLTSKNGRKKFLSFLFKKEVIRKKEKLQKMQRTLERSKSKEPVDDPEDSLPRNRITGRISQVNMLEIDNWRLASAMQFGPQVAFDFSFDRNMVRPEILKMLSQLNHVMNANKSAKDPFHVHWTGLKEGSSILREMRRVFSSHLQNLMVSITERDVTEMFPREKLIFLTPDSPNVMHTFDVDKVYIVGGLVDSERIQTGVTLAKAKRCNIAHARLPLDSYLQWGSGAKALTLDQVARILHTFHDTGDWLKALSHVPGRKHVGYKADRTINSRVSRLIESRQDPEVYHERKRQGRNTKKMKALGRERQGLVQDAGRFAFSHAKHEFKWDLTSKS